MTAPSFRTRLLAFALSASSLAACAKVPEGRSAVDAVDVTGNDHVDSSDIASQLATEPSPRFLGLFRGVVYDYEIFDRFALQRDLARVERYYRARGYYEAHARAGRILKTSDNHVRVVILVEEGQPVLCRPATIHGLEGVPPEAARAVERAAARRLREQRPFEEDKFKQAETDMKRALTDRGYAHAEIGSDAFVDIVHHEASPVFSVEPGEPATFGKITIVGLTEQGQPTSEIPESALRRTIDIEEGAPYSTAAIDAAQQALLDLGVLSSAEITPDLAGAPGHPNEIPITVKVEPSKLRRLRLGGGLEFDQIKTDLHLLAGWEDKNMLGGLRDFSVDFRPGVVLYPMRIDNIVAPDRLLPEERLRVQVRQPGFLEARTNGFIRPEFNVFPLLLKTKPNPDDPVLGYREFKNAFGVDRTFFSKLFVGLAHNLQVEDPFAYKGDPSPRPPTLVISYPELTTQLDLRDNPVKPHSGIFVGNTFQVAGGPFFGDARDVKVQPEVRTYIPLQRRLTFVTRVSIGFLFSSSYGDIVQNHLLEPVTDANREARTRDIETVFFRGFFSGGANSNRGFPLRGIAPHGVVPFLNPATASQQVALRCDPSPENNFNPDPALCSIPIGGFSLWEFSNELRISVSGPFSLATFCDMSDVSPRPANLRLDHLHLSCGLGARYDTPVGPIRLDVGYRIQPLQVLGYKNEDEVFKNEPIEGLQPKLLGAPIGIAIGIGEAY